MATYGGLIKYDTITKTKTFFNGANSGLSNNNVNTIYKDYNNVKWIGTVGGVVTFFNNNWTNYSISSSGDTLGGVKKIIGTNTDIYILSQSYQIPGMKIYKFNGSSFQFLPVPVNSNIIDIDIKAGKLWASYNTGIASFDGVSWIQYDSINTFPGGFSGPLAVDQNEEVWLYRTSSNYSQGYIYKFDGNSGL